MLAPGTRTGEYEVLRKVAEGATSEVYEGRHLTRGEPVAVKVLLPKWCIDHEMRSRFLNEARTLQEELQHPHLVKGLARGVLPENRPFLVLEWLPEDLHHALLRVGGRLSAAEAEQVIRQLAEVLTVLHARGVIHRDLKPANILVVHRSPGDWRVQLADLGLAKRLPDEGEGLHPVSTAGNARLGTWEYMAPEQWGSPKGVDARADVYSLGILWFQLLAGQLPFVADAWEGWMTRHVAQRPPMKLLEPLAPEPTRTLIASMLGKRPRERPTTEALLGLMSSTTG